MIMVVGLDHVQWVQRWMDLVVNCFRIFVLFVCFADVLFDLVHDLDAMFHLVVFLCVFGFSLTSLSRLFHSYREEPIGRRGETGVPRENHLTHPQAEHGLSHMWPVRGSNLHQSQR